MLDKGVLKCYLCTLERKSDYETAPKGEMKDKKEVKITFWAAHATTIVSVTLVLILVGIMALISFGASSETRKLRERIELSAVMNDSISNEEAARIMTLIQKNPEVKETRLISKEEAMQSWKKETGEDLEELFGVNIFSPEVSFTLNADATHPASIKKVEKKILSIVGVEEVAVPDATVVEKMNHNISTLSMILGGIAVVMLIISFVLINNTVHLTIYSRRFTIHTMQLVGATNNFIRGPFVRHNLLAGFLSGLVAAGVLALALGGAPKAGVNDIATYISWEDFGIVAVILPLAGLIICAFAAWLATARYLRKDYGELFR